MYKWVKNDETGFLAEQYYYYVYDGGFMRINQTSAAQFLTLRRHPYSQATTTPYLSDFRVFAYPNLLSIIPPKITAETSSFLDADFPA